MDKGCAESLFRGCSSVSCVRLHLQMKKQRLCPHISLCFADLGRYRCEIFRVCRVSFPEFLRHVLSKLTRRAPVDEAATYRVLASKIARAILIGYIQANANTFPLNSDNMKTTPAKI